MTSLNKAGRPFYWDVNSVNAFVIAIGLGQTADRFRVAEVDGVTLMSLTKEEALYVGLDDGQFEHMQFKIKAVIQVWYMCIDE